MKNPPNLDHGFGICEHTGLECSAAREAGNFFYAEPELEPMTLMDCIALGAIVLVSILIAFGLAGWLYGRFGSMFWAWASLNF